MWVAVKCGPCAVLCCVCVRCWRCEQVMGTEHQLTEVLYGNPGVDDSPQALAAVRSRYKEQLEHLVTAIHAWEDEHGQLFMHRTQRLLACVQTCLQVRCGVHANGQCHLRYTACVSTHLLFPSSPCNSCCSLPPPSLPRS